MLENYLQMFENLRTDKGKDRYPEITCHRAPHKPFVLLSVIDLIAQGRIAEDLIEHSWDLRDVFCYIDLASPRGSARCAGVGARQDLKLTYWINRPIFLAGQLLGMHLCFL